MGVLRSCFTVKDDFYDDIIVEGKKYYPYAECEVNGEFEYADDEVDCPAEYHETVEYCEIKELVVQDENDDPVTYKELLEKIKKEIESIMEGREYGDKINFSLYD